MKGKLKMNVDELYDLVTKYFGYKAKKPYYDSGLKEVTCTLYDSFIFNCGLNDRYGRFGGCIQVGPKEYITTFLGKDLSLNSDEESIKESLCIIDNYCRLRLPDKFLKAYDEAYKK